MSCLVVMLVFLIGNARGQETTDAAAPLHDIGRQVLRHLRDDDLDQALEVLGGAADRSTTWHPDRHDGLSAAVGGLHRQLAQLDTDQQYDLLRKWSLPTESRRSVRLLTALVPQDAPPAVFARALGERPRDTSFVVSEINGIRGLFSTAWMLVTAADDIGRLRRLTSELETLADDDVPNAETLLLLARIADNRGDIETLSTALEQRATALTDLIPGADEPAVAIESAQVAVAAAALKHEELRPVCEDMFNSLVELTYGQPASRIRPFLRVAHATAVQLNRGSSGPDALHDNRLKYWISTSGKTSALNAQGAVNAMWLVHEDHVLHLGGASNDVLFFRYPLTGEFEFRCESQEGGRIGTDGGLTYGGLQFQALGSTNQLTVWDADVAHSVLKPCPFVRHEERPTFNRMSIRLKDGQAMYTANLHPMWFDSRTAAHASPWLGLRGFDERRPMFRNFRMLGTPTIPREVRMSDGNDLRGWRSGFFGESQPAFAAGSTVSPQSSSPDWTLTDGVIVAPKHENEADAEDQANPQSVLCHQRPLLDGEAVAYEFHYQAGESEVHPALGRLAFLIEPAGVRIHWLTDGDDEWTGLPADNAVLEPLNRRGPRPLPLKEDDWNTVTLARDDGRVTVSLNDETIYQRPVDFGGDHTFGFYRDRTKSTAKIRNVVMTGDWPESLPEDFIENPVIVDEDEQAATDRQAMFEAGAKTLLSPAT